MSLGAYPLPVKLLVPEIHQAFDDSFTPLEVIRQDTDRFLEEFLWFAAAIYERKLTDTVKELS